MSDVDALLARLAGLEQANARLEHELRDLRLLVETTRTGGFRSMRDAGRCPACGGGALLHVRRAREGAYMGLMDFAIAHKESWTGIKPQGRLESFTCRACGLVELHVIDPAEVEVDGDRVVAVEPDGEPPRGGPFR